jgi:hypothetical protein
MTKDKETETKDREAGDRQRGTERDEERVTVGMDRDQQRETEGWIETRKERQRDG